MDICVTWAKVSRSGPLVLTTYTHTHTHTTVRATIWNGDVYHDENDVITSDAGEGNDAIYK